jgi:hypothetical protein
MIKDIQDALVIEKRKISEGEVKAIRLASGNFTQ